MERWQNKVAVVTGASSGIGEACVKALLAKGMIVVGLARRVERMDSQLKSNLPQNQRSRFHAFKCDVSKEADIKAAFEWIEKKLGGTDVLINNAGILRQTEILTADNSEDLRATIDTNVMGAALCAREAFQSMQKRGVAGHIIMMNSIVGHYVPVTRAGPLNMYPPSKHALTAMTEVIRQELQLHKTKTKVTSISPGAVTTEIIESIKDKIVQKSPILESEDIADAVVYCIQTPPHVQIHEMIIRPVGEPY